MFLLTASNGSLDKGDMLKEIEEMKELEIQLNVISFCSPAQIFHTMVQETGGDINVLQKDFSGIPTVYKHLLFLL